MMVRMQRRFLSVSFPLLPVVGMLLMPTAARAQSDLDKALEHFDAQTVKGYIKPMADFFGANMNAGWYHSADIPVTGLKIEVNIIGMGSLVGDDQKTFTATAPPGFSPATFETATIFGGKGKTIRNSFDTSLTYSGSDGIVDATLFPLAVPQLTVGSIYGTELTLRFVPFPDIDAFPKTTYFGVGARHSISQYLPAVPLDIAAGVFYTSFEVGDLIDFKGISIGAQASKTFVIATLYGGLAWENSTMNITYVSKFPGGGRVDIDLDGDNSFRFTVGAGLSLGFVKLFADANFGAVTNFSAGIGVGI